MNMTTVNQELSPSQMMTPITLLAVALLAFFVYQCGLVLQERKNLVAVETQQQDILKQNEAIKAQLDALSLGTLKLSEKGNRNAKVIIERMAQLGIRVNPDANVSEMAMQNKSAAPANAKPAAEAKP
jgi:hypothetical protein